MNKGGADLCRAGKILGKLPLKEQQSIIWLHFLADTLR